MYQPSKSSETWFVLSLGEYLQKWFVDLRNFTFSGFYGLKTAGKCQKSNTADNFSQFSAQNNPEKVKFRKSTNHFRRYPPKEGTNQVSELLDGWFSQEGT